MKVTTTPLIASSRSKSAGRSARPTFGLLAFARSVGLALALVLAGLVLMLVSFLALPVQLIRRFFR